MTMSTDVLSVAFFVAFVINLKFFMVLWFPQADVDVPCVCFLCLLAMLAMNPHVAIVTLT